MNTGNTLSRYETTIFDTRLEREFDDYVVIEADFSRDDASVETPYIIRNDSSDENKLNIEY